MRILTPAYGRDYTSKAQATEAYQSGKDWILNDITSPWDGKYCSCRDFPGEPVKLRYSKLRKSTITQYDPRMD